MEEVHLPPRHINILLTIRRISHKHITWKVRYTVHISARSTAILQVSLPTIIRTPIIRLRWLINNPADMKTQDRRHIILQSRRFLKYHHINLAVDGRKSRLFCNTCLYAVCYTVSRSFGSCIFPILCIPKLSRYVARSWVPVYSRYVKFSGLFNRGNRIALVTLMMNQLDCSSCWWTT